MSVKQPARAEVRDAQGKAKEIARRSTCSGDGRLCKRRARESYSGRSRYRWHGRIVWQKASTHQQGLFSIHSARTKICCPALGSGGLAGVERTRRRAVCGCSQEFATAVGRFSCCQSARRIQARRGRTDGGVARTFTRSDSERGRKQPFERDTIPPGRETRSRGHCHCRTGTQTRAKQPSCPAAIRLPLRSRGIPDRNVRAESLLPYRSQLGRLLSRSSSAISERRKRGNCGADLRDEITVERKRTGFSSRLRYGDWF